jgi:peptide/nickel transport system ATP-binding protein
MGLLPADLQARGSLRLAGVDHDLLTATERERAAIRGTRMSMIFQEPMTALNPLMKAGRQVAEMLTLHGERDRRRAAQRAVELLDRMGIPDPAVAAEAYPHQLSGGMRQRVMLAMAMANSPDLLLADEPTTALDVTVQAQVLELMRRQVREAGTTLLFITHDLAVISGLCERVLIMRDGVVVEAGPIDRVFDRPEHPYTRALLAASALATDPGTGKLITVPAGNPTTHTTDRAPSPTDRTQSPTDRALSLSKGANPTTHKPRPEPVEGR